jgi:hypothetical protein
MLCLKLERRVHQRAAGSSFRRLKVLNIIYIYIYILEPIPPAIEENKSRPGKTSNVAKPRKRDESAVNIIVTLRPGGGMYSLF